MSIHNLKRYKESLSLLPDIEMILKVLTLTEGALKGYSHYIPAYKVLSAARDQRKILEGHYKELKEIKKNKGRRRDDI